MFGVFGFLSEWKNTGYKYVNMDSWFKSKLEHKVEELNNYREVLEEYLKVKRIS